MKAMVEDRISSVEDKVFDLHEIVKKILESQIQTATAETNGQMERKVEVLVGEIRQTKFEISDLQFQVLYLKKNISVTHYKFNSKFSILDEILKKVLEGQNKKMLSEVREVTDSWGSGENSKPIRRKKALEMEISEGIEKMPPLGLILREELDRGYVGMHEGLDIIGRLLNLKGKGEILTKGGLNWKEEFVMIQGVLKIGCENLMKGMGMNVEGMIETLGGNHPLEE
ncbi:hypothetical protein MA16_Dca005589 [Dendrobium catenatum]|uniref:Uncharacterized protein n=1 Tax=Dendrobium catenatum TaxID=906689 RepID=A0A2I0WQ14_9ASPA|nr:hypothetical protein MA16_Dca005589 [Dendrobium catenatum]